MEFARASVDVSHVLHEVRVPTLVIHARDDEVVPFSEGQLLATEIPGAEFVPLQGQNHILLPGEPGWAEFKAAVQRFVGIDASVNRNDARLSALTLRERDILTAVAAGKTNPEVAQQLRISPKTVRNTLTRVYEKLGVSNRVEAALLVGQLPP